MKNLTLSVHEFMSIMGNFDERADKLPEESLYSKWLKQYRALDQRLEKLEMMERADMLFDGKVNINNISIEHLIELTSVVREKVNFHNKLILDNDEDADPEDLAMWEARLQELQDCDPRILSEE